LESANGHNLEAVAVVAGGYVGTAAAADDDDIPSDSSPRVTTFPTYA
jgi:hypothetical protein